jgi:hypothetical protein
MTFRRSSSRRPSRRLSGRSRAFARGDLVEEIERIKAQPGGHVIAYGGAGFARALIRQGLIDEYRLNIQPAALGEGMAIFTELPKPLHLELVEARAFGGGNAGPRLRAAHPVAGAPGLLGDIPGERDPIGARHRRFGRKAALCMERIWAGVSSSREAEAHSRNATALTRTVPVPMGCRCHPCSSRLPPPRGRSRVPPKPAEPPRGHGSTGR